MISTLAKAGGSIVTIKSRDTLSLFSSYNSIEGTTKGAVREQ
jgi:hypothetical protein